MSDVAFERDRVQDGRILVAHRRPASPFYLRVWPEMATAVPGLPEPRDADEDCRYLFWNGITSERAVVGIVERTLAVVFKASGVIGANRPRFRHTLATRLLGMSGTEQEVADVLGNSPAIVRTHYAKLVASAAEAHR